MVEEVGSPQRRWMEHCSLLNECCVSESCLTRFLRSVVGGDGDRFARGMGGIPSAPGIEAVQGTDWTGLVVPGLMAECCWPPALCLGWGNACVPHTSCQLRWVVFSDCWHDNLPVHSASAFLVARLSWWLVSADFFLL